MSGDAQPREGTASSQNDDHRSPSACVLLPAEVAQAAAAFAAAGPILSEWQLLNALARLRVWVTQEEATKMAGEWPFEKEPFSFDAFIAALGQCKERAAAERKKSPVEWDRQEDAAAAAECLLEDAKADAILGEFGLSSDVFNVTDLCNDPFDGEEDEEDEEDEDEESPGATQGGPPAGSGLKRAHSIKQSRIPKAPKNTNTVKTIPPPKKLQRVLDTFSTKREREEKHCLAAAEELW
eukprot:Hpha_TRINITY_DN15166_c4_g3::TRINITY_DN15166_c4_g3_i1::g.130084::m.130084